MRIFIFGANGMIGHKVYQELKLLFPDTWAIIKKDFINIEKFNIYNKQKIICNFDARNFINLENLLDSYKPDIIINAIGLTIRRGVYDSVFNSILINSSFPNFLNEWVNKTNKSKLIHFSTDCVFKGDIGNYLDNSTPDSNDLYGRTKALGEVIGPNTLTIRGSFIGLEIFNHTELLDWVISQNGNTIKGYSKVIYSGITTIRIARIIAFIIVNKIKINGIYNVSSIPISKYELIKLFQTSFNLNINVIKDEGYSSNKNLNSQNFYNLLGMNIPNWSDLILELKNDTLLNSNIYKL
jgi:dTDP-4-dehydrorhamnose reductase